MARDPEEILGLLKARKNAVGPMLSASMSVRDAYNGDVVIPLPELSRNEQSSVANLVALGLDQTAQRIASVLPDVEFPHLGRPSKKSERDAHNRRAVIRADWWHHNQVPIKMRRRARHFIGYGTSPVMILPPRANEDRPTWMVRDPLNTYPAPTADPDDATPDDCIFEYKRRYDWLTERYPEAMSVIHRNDNIGPDAPFGLVEYVDAEEMVLLLVGHNRAPWDTAEGAPWVVLERIPNRAGMCPAVVPGRITLDRRTGQFDSVVGLYQQQAKLMALEVIAVQKGIMPEAWLVARPGQQATVVNVPNPLTGEIGEVKGGDLQFNQINPGFATLQNVDRLERAIRVTSGIPAEFGGESQSNVRTGRRGEAILSSAIDFPIQEAQEVFATALREENRRAIAFAKSYGGGRSRSVFFPSRLGGGSLTYTPNDLFPEDRHDVFYASPGSDLNNLIISGGQRIGVGTLSKRSFMEMDPLVDDAEAEFDRVTVEGVEAAFLSSIQTQAADPAGPYQPTDLARLVELVKSDRMELFEAVQQVQREAQERQAAQAPPEAPETQPGLSPPGAGAEAGAAVQPPGPSINNLANLFGQLRRPAMALDSERGG